MIFTKRHYLLIALSLIAIIVSYFIWVKPRLMQLSEFREEEALTRAQLSDLKSQIEKHEGATAGNVTKSREYVDRNGRLLSGLTRMAEVCGLRVESIMHLNSENRTQMEAIGTYEQLLKLIDVLVLQKTTIYVEDYQIKTMKNGLLQMTVDLIAVLPVEYPLAINAKVMPVSYSNPFCKPGNQHVAVAVSHHDDIQRFPIAQMQMRGSIQPHHKAYVLIALPNNSQESVCVGDKIGFEHARVIAINQSEVTYKMPNGHIDRLRMDDL